MKMPRSMVGVSWSLLLWLLFRLRSTSGNIIEGECGLYLAESSIHDSGVGVFAGRNYRIGERIGYPSLGIQVTDPNHIYDTEDVLVEFGWNAGVVGGFGESKSVFSILPGVGMLANFHPTLPNVIPGSLSYKPSLRRDRDPGSGASTSYHNFTFLANKDIHAGDEIFASVSEGWFTYHDEKGDGPPVPLASEHNAADNILKDLDKFRKDHPQLSEAQFLDILRRIRNEMLVKNEKVMSLIPFSMAGFDRAINQGTARSALNQRGLEWLKNNGKCLDNIREGMSTIKGAGRGAFSTRFLPKGSTISTTPLVQIMDRANMENQNKDMETSDQQLLINYCFGHRKTSILLCPATSAVLINHSREKANAKIQWSDLEGGKLIERNLALKLRELFPKEKKLSDTNAKLFFDFVATRDIQPGEEIFIDYGEEWERQWSAHNALWKMREKDLSFVPSNIMNADEKPILISKEEEEESEEHGDHDYLCRLEPFPKEEIVADMPEEDFFANPTVLPHAWNNFTRLLYEDNDYMWWYPCKVVASSSTTTTDADASYSTVVYQKTPDDGAEPQIIRKFRNMPRDAIKFVDKPYHSDQHLQDAFRHYIPIPDDIFPLHWRSDHVAGRAFRLGVKNAGISSSDIERKEQSLDHEKKVRNAKCGVYIAPSTIPNAGMGTYIGVSTTGKGFDLGSKVPVIPVADMRDGPWDANDYTWSAASFGAEYEAGKNGHSQILAINEGCLANFHPGLVNHETGDVSYEPILDQRKDPGAGAFSDYVEFSFQSKHELKAGDEVFISYGEQWFQSRKHLKSVPLKEHYLEANSVVSSLLSLHHGDDDSRLRTPEVSVLLDIVKKSVVTRERTSKVLSSLNNSVDLVGIMTKNGTAEATTDRKSSDWLEENGYCTDHIYSKRSTIEQAGRGAFARRYIPKGDVVHYSPLLCTWGREMFDIAGSHIPNDVNRKQLAYNYQFGHKDSSVLFFPTTTALTINHQSTRIGRRPNLEIRWSQRDKKARYFLQRPLEDLKEEHYSTMMFEFVAARDIRPDEELFIDYGEEWENAWEEHVRNFVSPCGQQKNGENCWKSSKAISSMNDDKFNVAFHAWSEDHFSVCHHSKRPKEDEDNVIFLASKENATLDEIGEGASIDYTSVFLASWRNITVEHEGFELVTQADDWIPCVILRGDREDDVFDVAYFTSDTSIENENASVLRRARTLSARMIKFITKPYKSDMHWHGAFRHEIGIPDNIFPSHWKDLL